MSPAIKYWLQTGLPCHVRSSTTRSYDVDNVEELPVAKNRNTLVHKRDDWANRLKTSTWERQAEQMLYSRTISASFTGDHMEDLHSLRPIIRVSHTLNDEAAVQ